MEVPAQRAETLGRLLLVTFLCRGRKVTRLAGRNPPVLILTFGDLGQNQNLGRGVAPPLGALLFCRATKE
jgi:hypothetical protein